MSCWSTQSCQQFAFSKWLVSGSDIIIQTPPPHCHNYKMLPFHLAELYNLCLLFLRRLCPLFTVGAIRPTGLCPGQLVQNLCSSSTSVWGSVRSWERDGLDVMCPVRAGPESTLINTQLYSTYVWEGKWPVSNNTITLETVETDAEGSICPEFNCTVCWQILYTTGVLQCPVLEGHYGLNSPHLPVLGLALCFVIIFKHALGYINSALRKVPLF